MIRQIMREMRVHPLVRTFAALGAALLGLALLAVFAFKTLVWYDGRILPPRTPSPEVIEALTRDFHFQIGGKNLALPVLAVADFVDYGWLTGPSNWARIDRAKTRRDKVFSEAAQLGTGPQLDSLRIDLSYYSAAELRENPLTVLCPPLRTEWARRLCAGRFPMLAIGSVTLVAVSALPQAAMYTWYSDFPDLAHHAAQVISVGELSFPCHENRCLALLPVAEDLVFLWQAGNDRGSSRERASILKAFFDHALNSGEDFPALQRALCDLEQFKDRFRNSDICLVQK